eukprot:889756-Amphidinium_carterae.1
MERNMPQKHDDPKQDVVDPKKDDPKYDPKQANPKKDEPKYDPKKHDPKKDEPNMNLENDKASIQTCRNFANSA